nr:3408_t:CDS:2 [Entrophospora candida]
MASTSIFSNCRVAEEKHLTAIKKYNNGLQSAIKMCEEQSLTAIVRNIEHISQQFSIMLRDKRQQIFSEAYQTEKRQREEQEKRQNQDIIRRNIAEVVNNCVGGLTNYLE